MLTFFTTAKPFRDHLGVIQRNALNSWTRLHPDVEVILFGDEEGVAAAARTFGIRHEPHVERNEYGTKRLDYMFGKAQALARHDLLCYINCDIMLMQGFCHALARVKAAHPKFLMIGRRWDTDINEPYDFERRDWQTRLRGHALHKAKQRTPDWTRKRGCLSRRRIGAQLQIGGRMESLADDRGRYGSSARGRSEAERDAALGGGEAARAPGGAGSAVRRSSTGLVLVSGNYAASAARAGLAYRELAALARESLDDCGKRRMKAPFFTVIIDTYNYGQYVEEAVSSVLTQEFPAEEREILVVDDGSTDDTQERLKKFGDAIRYLRKTNGGQASAFNFGFEQARGEIIALLDADDVWLPDKLARLYEAFKQNPAAGMVYHRMYWWSGANETSADRHFIPVSGRVPESRRDLLQYPMMGTSCLTFRRDALKELLPVPKVLRSQADAYLTALIIFIAPVAAIPDYLGKYRLHGANLFQIHEERGANIRVEHRMVVRAALLAEIRCWLERRGHDLDHGDLQAYFKQWAKAQEQDGYVLKAPKRWKYFRHLVEYPQIYGEIMTARHRTYSYVQALAALFLGYHHLHLLDGLRIKYKQFLNLFLGGSLLDEERKATATKV